MDQEPQRQMDQEPQQGPGDLEQPSPGGTPSPEGDAASAPQPAPSGSQGGTNVGDAETVPQSAGYDRPMPGSVGRTTAPGRQILLTIVTLGIWSIVWVYRQHEDIRNYSGQGVGAALGAVIYFFASVITWFLIPNEVENHLYRRDGRESPVRTIMGFWFLLPIIGNFVWYLKVQRAINDFWISKGAEPRL